MMTVELLNALMPGVPEAQIRMAAVPWYVGRFVMAWAKHERMLIDMLVTIQEVDRDKTRDNLLDGQIADYAKSIKGVIEMLPADNEAIPYLNEIIRDHIPLSKLRNEVVHGFWEGIGPDDEFYIKRKIRKGDHVIRTIELEELSDGCQKLDRLGLLVINAGRAFSGMPRV